MAKQQATGAPKQVRSQQLSCLNRAQSHFIQALFALMAEESYAQITVSELAQRAQYDRRTFYRYFKTKEDVLYLYCATLLREMASAMSGRGPLTPHSGFLSYFEFWCRHRDFLLLLERHDLLSALSEKQDQLLYQNVGLLVHDGLPGKLNENSEFSQYAYYFTLGGLWASAVLWVRTGMKQTPEQLTQHVIRSFKEMRDFIE